MNAPVTATTVNAPVTATTVAAPVDDDDDFVNPPAKETATTVAAPMTATSVAAPDDDDDDFVNPPAKESVRVYGKFSIFKLFCLYFMVYVLFNYFMLDCVVSKRKSKRPIKHDDYTPMNTAKLKSLKKG